jgi:AhpD family alkylhydroperoxidase
VQKERILLTIAADRRDTYCVAMHSRVLSSLGATPGQIDDLLNEYRGADVSAPDLATLQFSTGLATLLPLFLAPNIFRPFLARSFFCTAEACLFAGLGENSLTAGRG